MTSKSTTSRQAKQGAVGQGGPNIVATSQTSRFHVDTLTTLSKEIDLKQVNISIGNREILVDAHIRLKTDVCYGLVGRNGLGKSTILKAIADKLIPGLPENIRILLVGQLEDTTAATGVLTSVTPNQPTVVEYVVQSDTRRQSALWEYKLLSAAAESGSNLESARALATVEDTRAKKGLELAQKTATKRSGTRGSEARKELLVAEARAAEAEAKLAALSQENTKEQSAEEVAQTLETILRLTEEVQATLEALNSDAAEANARGVLLGLGFSAEQLDAKFESLSGGWRSRCTLASALLQKPDLLILDEPTNYLDIPSVIWLQSYLQDLQGTTTLIVAHDRDFLDTVTQETIVLRGNVLTYHNGAISMCERAAAKKRKNKLRMRDALDKKRGAIEKSIAEAARTAKKSGDDNKARMAKSRQKKLDDRWGAEVNDKGHRFKLNRDFGGFHLTSRGEIEVEDLDPPVYLPLPDPDRMRFPGSLCSLAGVSFRYSTKSQLVLDDVTLTVQAGDRVGLVGKNGEGKSTLVKLLIGQLKPTKGTVERHPRLKLGYYSQHSVEELSRADVASSSSLEYFTEQLKGHHGIQVDDGTARSFLGSYGLQGRTATNPIGTLSGGQKVRLALALIVYPAPDLLVLDEVSTHLDMDTNNGLMRALRSFGGAILLVSHDRHLVRCVIEGAPLLPPSELDESDDDTDEDEDDRGEEQVKTGSVYRVGPKGRVRLLPGGVSDYVAIVERRLKRK